MTRGEPSLVVLGVLQSFGFESTQTLLPYGMALRCQSMFTIVPSTKTVAVTGSQSDLGMILYIPYPPKNKPHLL